MKKILFAIVLVLGMSVVFCSCQKEGGSSDVGGTLVGSWVLDEDVDGLKEYCEFTNDGFLKCYVLKPGNAYATYEKGVLYTPASNKWELYDTVPYSVNDGILSCKYLDGFRIKVVDKDTIQVFEYYGSEILDSYYYRIRKFSTK